VIVPTHRVIHNIASLYNEPDSGGEQISQLTYGFAIELHTASGEFSRIIGEDLYPGWIRSTQIAPIGDDSDFAISTVAGLFAEMYDEPDSRSDIKTRLTAGARIVVARTPEVNNFVPIVRLTGGTGYIHRSQVSLTYFPSPSPLPTTLEVPNAASPDQVVSALLDQIAASSIYFVGVPYLWGGTTSFGLDCSGFTQLVYKLSGIQLLRDASLQYSDRRFEQIDCSGGFGQTTFDRADLLFFGRGTAKEQKITHVGLALGDGRFVHSAGKGRGNILSPCSDQEFSTTFIGARRLSAKTHLSIDFA
jgi:gamma-D-glutamyl-L-lysine dipeptidyl-peptidase